MLRAGRRNCAQAPQQAALGSAWLVQIPVPMTGSQRRTPRHMSTGQAAVNGDLDFSRTGSCAPSEARIP